MLSISLMLCLANGFSKSQPFLDQPSKALVLEIYYGGVDVGKNVFTNSNGTIHSVTTMSIGGTKIESTLDASLVDHKLNTYSIVQSQAGSAVSFQYKDGLLDISIGGKETKVKVPSIDDQLFSNLHPQVMGWVAQAVKTAQPIEPFFLENGVKLKVSAKADTPKSAIIDGAQQVVSVTNLSLSTVDLSLYTYKGVILAEDIPAQNIRFAAPEALPLFKDPFADYPGLSQPTHETMIKTGVDVPMRDGTILKADIEMPKEPGRYPAIITRTPYGRADSLISADVFVKRGYVFISQDVRGTGDSKGAWDPFINEGPDGFDTIQWAASQPWCDGNVGTIGGSYLGVDQWQAAVLNPPALKCMIPQVSPPDAMTNLPYEFGTFVLVPDLWWSRIMRSGKMDKGALTQPLPHPLGLMKLPIGDVASAVFGTAPPYWKEWVAKEGLSKWAGFDYENELTQAKAPALNISGWWDGDGIGTELHWLQMAKAGRTNQWVILGPWPHAFNTVTKLAGMDYGPTAHLELDPVYVQWFDTWLKGKDVGLEKVPKAKYFVTGANKWMSADTFPDPLAQPTSLYLGDGLSLGAAPEAGQDKYTYDPGKVKVNKAFEGNLMASEGSFVNPAPPKDDSTLVYTSTPFNKSEVVTGPFGVDLFFKVDTVDTDLYAVLFDVHPDGKWEVISVTGKLRCEFLGGLNKPVPLVPGKTYEAHVMPWWSAHQFDKGHKLCVVITSSAFPMTARNLNRGEPIATATKWSVAHIQILRGPKTPSRVTFFKQAP